MRHPFAGIIGLDVTESAEGSRRTALKVMLAGAGTALVSGGALGPALAADDAKADGDRAASDHAAYLVVPRDFRTFRADRRQALGVLGDYYRGAPDSKNLRGKGGFLGWLTAEAAKKVAAANDVAEVLALTADDKPGPEAMLIDAEDQALVGDLLAVLDDRARYAVEARFGLADGRKKSYREVGEELGVTAEAARRLVKRAVTAVREEALARSDAA